MKTLMEKDLVFERGRPLRKYALTEDGWDVARRLRKTGHVNQDLLQGNDNPTVKVSGVYRPHVTNPLNCTSLQHSERLHN